MDPLARHLSGIRMPSPLPLAAAALLGAALLPGCTARTVTADGALLAGAIALVQRRPLLAALAAGVAAALTPLGLALVPFAIGGAWARRRTAVIGPALLGAAATAVWSAIGGWSGTTIPAWSAIPLAAGAGWIAASASARPAPAISLMLLVATLCALTALTTAVAAVPVALALGWWARQLPVPRRAANDNDAVPRARIVPVAARSPALRAVR